MKLHRLVPLLALLAPLVSANTRADTPAPAASPADAELVRLRAAQGHSVKWNYVPQGQAARYGHAEVIIQSPLDMVRTFVTDFAHYKDFSSGKFKQSRIIDRPAQGVTDLYVQVPIFHGMIMLWQVVRFAPIRTPSPGLEVVEGTLVRGNVRASNVVLTMRVVDPVTTILKCDLLITPEMDPPQASVDEELRDAAQNAIDAIQVRAQTKYAQSVAAAVAGATVTPPPAPSTTVASGNASPPPPADATK